MLECGLWDVGCGEWREERVAKSEERGARNEERGDLNEVRGSVLCVREILRCPFIALRAAAQNDKVVRSQNDKVLWSCVPLAVWDSQGDKPAVHIRWGALVWIVHGNVV